MDTLAAVWPITDPDLPTALLYAEARKDLPSVAARHNARITGEPQFQVRLGKRVPGSQGAEYVVTATVPAEPLGQRDYGRPHHLGAVA